MPSYPQSTITAQEMVGHIRRLKANLPPDLALDFLNQRIRSALDRRPYWAGTLKSGVIAVPGVYSTGTISFTAGSTSVTGTDTAWAVSDKVNTTIAAGVPRMGMQWVTPGSMSGIDADTVLYVDSAGTAEIVPVLEAGRLSFRANFTSTHSAGCTLTSSSLAGRQIRLGMRYPSYTVRAITSATACTIDKPWAGPDLDTSYQIAQQYYTLAPDMKMLMLVADLTQMIPLRIHISQVDLNVTDPQRSQAGAPHTLADYAPNECGNMQYELYPIQTVARQLPYLYAAQWPELRANGDRPPYFINPNVFIWGAAAQALMTKVEANDPFYDPMGAKYYEAKAEMELLQAMQADEAKAQQAYSSEMTRIFGVGMGADWRASHAVSNYDGFGGGGEWW